MVPSLFNLWSMASRTMNVPVLPTPALQCTSRGGPAGGCFLRTKEMKAVTQVLSSGTPWSGQAVKWYWVTLNGERESSSIWWHMYKTHGSYNGSWTYCIVCDACFGYLSKAEFASDKQGCNCFFQQLQIQIIVKVLGIISILRPVAGTLLLHIVILLSNMRRI